MATTTKELRRSRQNGAEIGRSSLCSDLPERTWRWRSGTWIVYPWYRESLAGDDFAGCEGAQIPIPGDCSPRDVLNSKVSGDTENWHHFGMEWNEHVAWLAPMFATTAAFIVAYYGTKLARPGRIRRMTITLFVLAFAVAAVAGILGALITKVAPVK